MTSPAELETMMRASIARIQELEAQLLAAQADAARLDWLLLHSEFSPETTTYFWNSPEERKASGRKEIDAQLSRAAP
jgi:hypothetical protein